MNEHELKQAMDADPEFEGRLKAALELPVAELLLPELPASDADNVVALPARNRIRPSVWLATAAVITLAVFLGFRGDDLPQPSLESQLLAHLDYEPHALTVSNTPVSDRKLAAVVPASIASMNHDAGLITYAASCEINGNTVPHLVVQGERGPVTILLMPEEKVSEARSLTGESVNGVILPVGDGSIAIIGEKAESLERIKQNVLDSVSWTT